MLMKAGQTQAKTLVAGQNEDEFHPCENAAETH